MNKLALLTLTSLAVVRGVNAYVEDPEDGKVFVVRFKMSKDNRATLPPVDCLKFSRLSDFYL